MSNAENRISKGENIKKPLGAGFIVAGLIGGGVPGALAAVLGTAIFMYSPSKEKPH